MNGVFNRCYACFSTTIPLVSLFLLQFLWVNNSKIGNDFLEGWREGAGEDLEGWREGAGEDLEGWSVVRGSRGGPGGMERGVLVYFSHLWQEDRKPVDLPGSFQFSRAAVYDVPVVMYLSPHTCTQVIHLQSTLICLTQRTSGVEFVLED